MTRPEGFDWDPFDTLHRALWIGGAQWAGKSTVARIVATRHGLTAYHHDYPAARGHQDRRAAAAARVGAAGTGTGTPLADPGPPDWLGRTPAELAEECREAFADQLGFVFDDLRALVSPRPILAEGWALRPEALAPLLAAPDRMIVMVPTEEFRRHQIRTLPRAGAVSAQVDDPVRAQENRVERDRILAEDVVRAARENGVRVLEIDGSRNADQIADEVSEHFAAHL